MSKYQYKIITKNNNNKKNMTSKYYSQKFLPHEERNTLQISIPCSDLTPLYGSHFCYA